MEPRFGHDFSRVRVHTDAKATESAQAVKAAAYTVGRDIVFNQNHYDPHSAPGRFLLAHELAHTFQQGQAGSVGAADRAELQIGAPNDRSEAEADDVAAWLFSPYPDNGAAYRPLVSNTKPILARFDCSRLDHRKCRTGVYKCGYGNSGTCGWVGPARGGCICVGAIKPPVPPVPVPERAEQEARVRVRVRAHPYFEDDANRLPYMEAPPGREFIVVIDDGIFKQVVAEAEALRIQQTKRLLRPADPRNLPFIQVEPVLIGGGRGGCVRRDTASCGAARSGNRTARRGRRRSGSLGGVGCDGSCRHRRELGRSHGDQGGGGRHSRPSGRRRDERRRSRRGREAAHR